MKFETVLDIPVVKKSSVLRKGFAFLGSPVAAMEKLTLNANSYSERPSIFVNSLPKSGTHLLLQVTRALPNVRYFGRFIATSPSITQKERSPKQLAKRISAILPLETLGCHMYYSPEAKAALQSINAIHLFIYRDPRDVLTSEAYYLSEMNRWHRMHKHYSKLTNDRDRLQLAMDGFDSRYPDCNSRLLPYAGWLHDPNTLAIRYEDISGTDRDTELSKIVDTFIARTGGRSCDRKAVLETVKMAIDPKKSHTFRKGGSGKWREGLSTAEAASVTENLKPSLEAFGYT